MAIPSAIDTLIELATNATDEAARQLGRAIRAADETEQKLALLVQYREDYAVRFQANLAAGLSATGYSNFRLFMEKLDQAIDGQQQIVREAQRRTGEARSAWQANERKRISYDTLADRALKVEQIRESRRDQKQTDEQAARKLLYKR
ncbi:MAG: fliJ [Herminiimonas sp.]|jgi:flagellar FliJ protein|nr:fliJ [Herminiimonas sp.]